MITVKNLQYKLPGYYSLIFTLLLFACKKKIDLYDIPNENTKVISISLSDSPEWHFNEIFEIKKAIALDSRVIISEVNKLVFHNEKILILDQKSKSVIRFAQDGSFEKRIHFVGRGPEEYTDITDFIIDKENDNIIVLDGVVGQQMVWYDWDGSFIKKQQLPFSSNSFEEIGDGYMIYCGNHQSKENAIDDNNFNNIIFCDRNFNIRKSQISVPSFWNGRGWLFKKVTAFSRYGESTFFQAPMPNNNTIYKLSNGMLRPHYEFDFGYDLDKVLREEKSVKAIVNKINKKEIPYHLNSYFENDQIVYFSVLKGDKIHQIIYYKSSEKVFCRSVNLKKLDKSFFPTEYHGNGTYLVHVLLPFLISGSELENYIPEEIRNKYTSQDNPILLFFQERQPV